MEKVTTLQEFLAEIQKIGKTENTRFYRGHSNKNYEIKPSIYRDEKYIENEDKIYKEVIARVPNEFEGKTTIEALTMMQHYDVPTRILDITSNPLVALYFACLGSDKTDAEVLVFDIPEDDVCFSDSDRVTVLANLVKCDRRFCYGKCRLIFDYEKGIKTIHEKKEEIKTKKENPFYYHNLEKELIQNFKEHNKLYAYVNDKAKKIKTSSFEQEEYIKSLILFIEDLVSSFEYFRAFIHFNKEDIENVLRLNFYDKVTSFIDDAIQNLIPELNEEYFSKLLHNIREDKSYFQPIINPNDVNSVLAVKPKLNNPRIIRQQGAFLIFGIIEMNIDSSFEIKPMAKLNEDWILRGEKHNNPNSERIIISKNKKKRILDELDELGINQATLFPEIDKVGAYIKEKLGRETKEDSFF